MAQARVRAVEVAQARVRVKVWAVGDVSGMLRSQTSKGPRLGCMQFGHPRELADDPPRFARKLKN